MTHGSTLPVGRGLWYVCIAATAWGTGGAAAAILYDISGLGPVTVSWWRFVSGALLLAAARRWFGPGRGSGTGSGGGSGTGRRWSPGRLRDWPPSTWRLLAVTGIGLAVYQTAYYVAIGLCGLAVATVVTLGAGPVLIAAGARIAGIERAGAAATAAVAVALAGLVLLVAGGAAETPTEAATGTGTRLAGIGFALLSAAGYATVTLLTRKGGNLHRYDAALGGFVVGAIVLAPLTALSFAVPGPEVLAPTPDGRLLSVVGLLVYLAVVPSALAYGLFFAGLAVVRATTASVVALVEPLTATLVAVALLGERLRPAALAGSALLLCAVLVLARSERRTTT